MFIIRRLNPSDTPATEERRWELETAQDVVDWLCDPSIKPANNLAFCGRRLVVRDGSGEEVSSSDFLDDHMHLLPR